MMNKSEIYKRLYKDYSKQYLNKIVLSALFSILVAASTSAIAWLLDPAIKKLFIEVRFIGNIKLDNLTNFMNNISLGFFKLGKC